jgi:ASCH domain
MSEPLLALSVKQPWAALIVAGLKTVEIRTWATRVRGPVLIHASKSIDPRPEGWALITTPELRALAALRGGILGSATLSDCVNYDTADAFAEACTAHRNAPEWFRASGLYGFVFHSPRLLAYHTCPGRTMFFAVNGIAAEE